uniref:Parvalbumin n=1 Tax=Myripristis murdjan TaxID=586833 RepID=A0A668AE70_9TELE
MSLTSILSAEAIDKALKECQAPESFDHKKFFQSCGLSSKTAQEVKEVFRILDDDNSGYIEEAEFKFFLQRFKPDARILTDKEAKSLISAADNDSDGKIGAEGQDLFFLYEMQHCFVGSLSDICYRIYMFDLFKVTLNYR